MGLICTASNSIMHIWGQCTQCSFPKERNQAKKETNAWVPTDEWLWGMQVSLVVSTNSKYLSHWALLWNFSQCSSLCANNMISTEEKQQGIQYQDRLCLQTSHFEKEKKVICSHLVAPVAPPPWRTKVSPLCRCACSIHVFCRGPQLSALILLLRVGHKCTPAECVWGNTSYTRFLQHCTEM